MIVAISGKSQHGKGEFANWLARVHGFQVLSFASGVKEEVAEFLESRGVRFTLNNLYGSAEDKNAYVYIPLLDGDENWFLDYIKSGLAQLNHFDGGHTAVAAGSFRSLLQWWGTNYRRHLFGDDYWIKRLHAKIQLHKNYVIDDLRFRNELEALSKWGAKLVRVNRTNAPLCINAEHPSECDLDNYDRWDWVIQKEDSLKDYHHAISVCINHLLKERLSSAVDIKVKLLRESVKLPSYGTDGAAGLDIYSPERLRINPGRCIKIPTGFALEIPRGMYADIRNRSSMFSQTLVDVDGLIDSDYRGEVFVMMRNVGADYLVIEAGDRIAQLLFKKTEKINFNIVDELSQTNRGPGGFGSTGK